MSATDPQPQPTPNDHPGATTLALHYGEQLVGGLRPGVVSLLESRRALGLERYGTELQPFNGRSVARDLSDEIGDGIAYAAVSIAEAEAKGRNADAATLRRVLMRLLGAAELLDASGLLVS